MTINYYNKATKRHMIFKYKVLPQIQAYATILLLVSLYAIASTITN